MLAIRVCCAWCVVSLVMATVNAAEKLTFLVTSDSHYEAIDKVERNDRNRVTLERMNAISEQEWPANLGGGKIGTPRGVLALGDLIDDGDRKDETAIQWRHFVTQFGLTGQDGVLKYRVYEGFGNHDGPPVGKEKHGYSMRQQFKDRNLARQKAGWLTNLSPNELHYSWDWEEIHFVQLNIYPADKQNDRVKYNRIWHDPELALEFLKQDLQKHVADSGRPVVLMSHCGFDTDWWIEEDWTNFYQAIKPYNVVLFMYGHSGTGLKTWQPMNEMQPLQCVNTGQTEKGFFVIEFDQERYRLAFHGKVDAQAQQPEWAWKYPLQKKYSRTAADRVPEKSAPAKAATTTPVQPTPDQPAAPKPAVTQPVEPVKAAAATTPPAPLPRRAEVQQRFAVIGDFGLAKAKVKVPPPAGTPAEDIKKLTTVVETVNPNEAAVAALVKSWQPDYVLTVGDNNYPRGDAETIDENIGQFYSDFIGNYRGKFGAGSRENRFFPAIGNHDWAPKVGWQAHVDYFTLPGNERYYTLQRGPLDIIILNSDGNEKDGVTTGSKQHQWFEEQIKQAAAPLRVVVFHHPPYSSGEHGNNPKLDWKFPQYGVDVVLSGHDHNYERIVKDGVQYIVNGAGGASIRKFGKKIVPESVVRFTDKYGAMLGEVEQTATHAKLRLSFHTTTGTEIDHIEITKPLAAGK
jgi:cytolysin (calcineurin-like family phosphatase)/predicted phosphodiesterase